MPQSGPTWWPHILAFIRTGITNAGSEGTNRVIKTVARDAFGFRNPVEQRLRTRCATPGPARRRPSPQPTAPPASYLRSGRSVSRSSRHPPHQAQRPMDQAGNTVRSTLPLTSRSRNLHSPVFDLHGELVSSGPFPLLKGNL
ncbi:transposase [Micromonospora sp. NPDC049175]|uniref:transposase n=1 Tax=Micromonospora sp. NPDC049175 TaxID=3364266 RepID=UPI003721118D